jgi:hypothetical protein
MKIEVRSRSVYQATLPGIRVDPCGRVPLFVSIPEKVINLDSKNQRTRRYSCGSTPYRNWKPT